MPLSNRLVPPAEPTYPVRVEPDPDVLYDEMRDRELLAEIEADIATEAKKRRNEDGTNLSNYSGESCTRSNTAG